MKNFMGLGNKIELITEAKSDGKRKLYYSSIQEVSEGNDEVTILAPIEMGRIIPLEINERYGMCIYTEKGLYRCEVVVVNREKDDNLYLITLEILTELQKYQRRQFYRLDCILTFQYRDDSSAEENWCEGLILDISGGGMRFTSKDKLEVKKGIVIHLELSLNNGEENLYLSGIIIESIKAELDDTLFENRVEFDNISNDHREVVIKFIFDEERRRRNNNKG